VVGLALTCDHRVIDGAPAARFLETFNQLIGNLGIDDYISQGIKLK
jgi:pyruvate/2-oxoglutarate dehydrogenase complex dihydrolipoamide acyltransferase (E2) component